MKLKQAIQYLPQALARAISYLRRRRHAVKAFAQTRDRRGVIRYYDAIAIPRTLEKLEYDVRIKRYALGGSNVENIEAVWPREKLQAYVHDCS